MDAKEFTKQIQAYIDDEKAKGHYLSFAEINAECARIVKKVNEGQKPSFLGFSPEEMSLMVYHPFEPGCPVQMRTDLTEEELSQAPFLRQALYLMNELNKGFIKLTERGNIPTAYVKKMYELGSGEYMTIIGVSKINKENDSQGVMSLHYILKYLGYIKERLGKMSITEKGRKALSNPNEINVGITKSILIDADLSCYDFFDDKDSGNVGKLFTLWMIHHFGNEWHKSSFYYDHYLKAFPMIGINNAYDPNMFDCRIFERFFFFLGLVELENTKSSPLEYDFSHNVRKTSLLDMMFTFKEP